MLNNQWELNQIPYIDVRRQIFCLSNIFILDFNHRPNKSDSYSWYGFLHLEGNKPNCGGNSLSETDGNKKANKSQQTNKKFGLLPSILFCECYLIQGICDIFISTAGCFPHFALLHAMKHFCLWDKENTQNIDIRTWYIASS